MEPNIENVVYIDEYPHIEERLRLRRLYAPKPIGNVALLRNVLVFPTIEEHFTSSTEEETVRTLPSYPTME